MTGVYPHDAMVRAWLDGKTVQWLDVDDTWVDLAPPDAVKKMPLFYPTSKYRLKPITVRIRIGVMANGNPALAASLQQADLLERRDGFLRWLTDWQEFTV
jgi:hypothetical protein